MAPAPASTASRVPGGPGRPFLLLVLLLVAAADGFAAQKSQRGKKGKEDEPLLERGPVVPVGQTPSELEWTDADTLWVSCSYDTALVRLDGEEHEQGARLRLSPISPLCFHVERNGKTAVVCNYAADTLAWVDLKSGEVLEELALEFRPSFLWVTADGKKAAVSCGQAQSVHFVDLVARRSLGPPAVLNGPPHRIVADRTGRNVYVACGGDAPLLARLPFGANEGGFWEAPLRETGPLVLSPDGKSVIAAATDGGLLLLDAAGGGPVPESGAIVQGRKPFEEKVDDALLLPDGEHLALLFGRKDEVAVLELKEWTVTERLPTGKGPVRMALSGDGRTLAVADRSGGTVSFYAVRR